MRQATIIPMGATLQSRAKLTRAGNEAVRRAKAGGDAGGGRGVGRGPVPLRTQVTAQSGPSAHVRRLCRGPGCSSSPRPRAPADQVHAQGGDAQEARDLAPGWAAPPPCPLAGSAPSEWGRKTLGGRY